MTRSLRNIVAAVACLLYAGLLFIAQPSAAASPDSGPALADDRADPQCFAEAVRLLDAQAPPRADVYFFAAKHLAEPACGDAAPAAAVRLLALLLRDYGASIYAATLHDVLTKWNQPAVEPAVRESIRWAIALDAAAGKTGAEVGELEGETGPDGLAPLLNRLQGLSSRARVRTAISKQRRRGPAFSGVALHQCLQAAAEAPGALAADEAVDCARIAYAVAARTPFEDHASDLVLIGNGLVERAARRGDRAALKLGAERQMSRNASQGRGHAFQWLLALEAAGGDAAALSADLRSRLSRDDQETLRELWLTAGFLPPLPLPSETPRTMD